MAHGDWCDNNVTTCGIPSTRICSLSHHHCWRGQVYARAHWRYARRCRSWFCVLAQRFYWWHRHPCGTAQQIHSYEFRSSHADVRLLYHRFVVFPLQEHRDDSIWCGVHAYCRLHVRLCHQRYTTDCAILHHIKEIRRDCRQNHQAHASRHDAHQRYWMVFQARRADTDGVGKEI